jgi:pimeloyl-ACP methyl ester carboxylesterase
MAGAGTRTILRGAHWPDPRTEDDDMSPLTPPPQAPEPDTQQLRLTVGELVFDAVQAGPDDGRLVLLLHGFPQTSWSWRRVWPSLAAQGYRVVAVDQRGYSPDASPDDAEQYTTAHLVGDVLGFLDALGADRADVVGHDWGAAVAWQLAAHHPGRVRTLTAVSVPHPKAFQEALTSDPDQQKRSAYMRAFASAGFENVLLAEGAARLRGLFQGSRGVDVDHVVERLGEPRTLRRALNWYTASTPALPSLPAITSPTLHVWSDGDLALGETATLATARYVDGPYRLEVLPGVSHWIPEDAPDELSGLLLDHLSRDAEGA